MDNFSIDLESLLPEVIDDPEQSLDYGEEVDRLSRPAVVHKVALLYISGQSYKQIGEQLGVRAGAVKALTKRAEFTSIMDELGSAVIAQCKSRLIFGASQAVSTLIGALESDKDNVRLAAANSILDRAGLSKIDKVEVKNQVNNLSIVSDDDLVDKIVSEMQRRSVPSYAKGEGVIDCGDFEVNDCGGEVGTNKEESL